MIKLKKKTFFLLLVIIGIFTVSCFKNKEEKKSSDTNGADSTSTTENTTSKTNGDIFNLGKNDGQQQNNQGQIQNLTAEEQQNFINNKIDPAKVSQAIKDAESGNKEAILSLAHLYYGLKDNAKTKKYLQMGVDKNYPEAIYNLAVLLKEEGNIAEANKLMAKLPKNSANGQMVPGAEAYNKGVNFVRAKNYKEAKTQFESAYRQGIREADIQVALLNKQMKNYDEAVKWFKLALNRGVKEANLEIGAILFDTGRQVEARSYLMKAYNSGNKGLAMPIAISYHKENNMSEALKWYKIAAKNGDKEAKETVAEIEGNKTANNSGKGVNQFLNVEKPEKSKTNITNTLAQTKKDNNVPSSDSSAKNAVSTNTNAASTMNRKAKQSTAREKQNYNIGIDEVTDNRMN